MLKDDQKYTKKQLADDIYKQLTPHFSALLGSNTGLGIGTGSISIQDFNNAVKLWFEQGNTDELIGYLRTAQVTGVISEQELNKYLDTLEQVS